mmetsp:Transcript_27891/g.37251  ORF Transcript_27891/g.37251 Transcript_27891/m.37251 type:complete len:258 (+) Transcript_27891:588-1361(+)
MEHKLEVRRLCSHHVAQVAIEDLQSPLIGGILRLIDGLETPDGGVLTPLVDKAAHGVLSPEEGLKVDVVVALAVPGAHPLTDLNLVVHEVGLIDPSESVLLAGVIEAILGAFDSMDVEQHFDIVLSEAVQSPRDLISGAVHAADVGSVLLEGPVTDGQAHELNAAISEALDVLLREPGVPVRLYKLVSFFGAEGLAESPLAHADALAARLAEESVEERGGDPGLEHHPAADVGANHSRLSCILLGRDSGCEEGGNNH